MADIGDIAAKAFSKAEEVYKELVTTKVQVEHITEKVKEAELRLHQRFAELNSNLVQGQHNFHQQVFARLDAFEARLRELEREQAKLGGTLAGISTEALSHMVERQAMKTAAMQASSANIRATLLAGSDADGAAGT